MKGHVRERGAGNWYAVIDARDPLTGARKRKWLSLPSATGKRQAQIECARLISEAQTGGLSLEPAKTTLSDYLERWLDYARPNISPRSHERNLYSHVMPGMQEEAAVRVDEALRIAMAKDKRGA
jgi:hypothetical protein